MKNTKIYSFEFNFRNFIYFAFLISVLLFLLICERDINCCFFLLFSLVFFKQFVLVLVCICKHELCVNNTIHVTVSAVIILCGYGYIFIKQDDGNVYIVVINNMGMALIK